MERHEVGVPVCESVHVAQRRCVIVHAQRVHCYTVVTYVPRRRMDPSVPSVLRSCSIPHPRRLSTIRLEGSHVVRDATVSDYCFARAHRYLVERITTCEVLCEDGTMWYIVDQEKKRAFPIRVNVDIVCDMDVSVGSVTIDGIMECGTRYGHWTTCSVIRAFRNIGMPRYMSNSTLGRICEVVGSKDSSHTLLPMMEEAYVEGLWSQMTLG